MQSLGDYVSHMAGDYINTDYLRKIFGTGLEGKSGGETPSTTETNSANAGATKDEIKVPKFKLRQQNFVSQIEIDKNTRF